jgi:hypothetical protein
METSMEVDQQEELPTSDRVLVHPVRSSVVDNAASHDRQRPRASFCTVVCSQLLPDPPPSHNSESKCGTRTKTTKQLAIVNMSDQYTRIRYGGSPLECDAPVTGLLFGTRRAGSAGANNQTTGAPTEETVLEVRDAEDIPLDLSESAKLQEELHRAVFPSHHVVGWYRVAESDDVMESDVTFTDALARHYRHNNSTSSPFVFALLVIDGASSAVGGGDKDGEDEPLPLTVYRQADGGVLHNVPDWVLETLDSERIAVERVIREQPPPAHAHAAGDDPDSAAAAGDAMTSLSLDGPRFVQHTHTLDHSLSAIHRRLDVLRTFLQDTLEEKIPWNASLIRQVNEVMLQAGAIHRPAAADSDPTSNVVGSSSDMMVPIAYLLKTVDAVRSYSDKFRAAHDSTATSASSSGAGPLSSVARSRDRDYSKRL